MAAFASNKHSSSRPQTPAGGLLEPRIVRYAVGGFFLVGLLMSFPGAVLPAWGYHVKSDYSAAALHFLGMALGILGAMWVSHRLVPRKGIRFALSLAAGISCGSLMYLALVPPPAAALWRFAGVLILGIGAGLLLSALFYVVSGIYRHDPAATVNIAGLFFGLGSLVTVLLVYGTFYVYTVPSILFMLALAPGFFAGIFARERFDLRPARIEPSWKEAWHDFRVPSTVLFALLLFFQFGNEWSIAGWLAIFLIQRIGVSPTASLLLLAFYWLALLVGRIVAQFLLHRVRHGRLLTISTLAALLGCVILSSTKDVFGAASGILFVGTGFAMVYPLVVEKIGDRFPYFHPGVFNGIFSFAMIGGLLAPWTIGYFAETWGIGIAMAVPLLGSFMVNLLIALIWLEAKLSAHPSAT